MHNCTRNLSETEEATWLECYLDLYFGGLTPMLRDALLKRASHVDIASLLSDNPHGKQVSPSSVGIMIRRRFPGGGQ